MKSAKISQKTDVLKPESIAPTKLDSSVFARFFKEYIQEKIDKNKGAIIEALLKKARKGDIPAIKELLDRGIGKPTEVIEQQTTISIRIDI